jgi:hypothetical protein
MKYIKTFENMDIPKRRADLQDYNEGDCVLFKAEDEDWNEVLIQGTIKDYYLSGPSTIQYVIDDETEPTSEWSQNFHISGADVVRKLTEEEEKEYKIKCAAAKYNL